MSQLKQIIEALIFASDSPLTVDRMREALNQEIEPKAIRAACQELRAEYDELDRAFELKEVAAGFQFRTRPEFAPYLGGLVKTAPLRLSRAALEALSVVVYKQPVLRAEVERIRGVDSGGVLKMLLERNFIRIVGRENVPGRPLTYGTTKKFLETFELKSLDDLPRLEELSMEDGLVGLPQQKITAGSLGLNEGQAELPLGGNLAENRPPEPTVGRDDEGAENWTGDGTGEELGESRFDPDLDHSGDEEAEAGRPDRSEAGESS